VAEDGRSALTSVSHRTFVADADPGPTTFGAPPAERQSSTSITAEIPAVPAGSSYGVLLPDGTVWYPGSKKRLPAPLLLRVVVWILAFATVLAGAGTFVIYEHPSWVNPFRRIVATQPGPKTKATKGSHGRTGSSGAKSTAVGPIVPQPSGLPFDTTAYRVPAGPYSVKVAEAAGREAWVGAFAVGCGQISTRPSQQQILSGGQTFVVNETGEFDLEVGASGATVQVLQNGKVLATVPAPSRVPWRWLFEPPSP